MKRLKTHHFHTKQPYQKPMLRQIEWWVQNGPMIQNGVFPVSTLFFWKFCFSLRTSSKELIWCSNEPNAHIRTFCKHWNFIWQCFFPVSILKLVFNTFKIKNYFSYKGLIPHDWKSFLVYKFTCPSSSSGYIGKTCRHFKARIDENIKKYSKFHLHSTARCFDSYNSLCFEIIRKVNSRFDL